MSFTIESPKPVWTLYQPRVEEEKTVVITTSIHSFNLEDDYVCYHDQDRNKVELAYGHIVRSSLWTIILPILDKIWGLTIIPKKLSLNFGLLFPNRLSSI